ncbi:hypothetical protein JCM3765_007274 [Sporobolomyces pararoseus]
MPKHPLTTLRFKIAKTTIFLPVPPTSNFTTLRETLLSALKSTSTSNLETELLNQPLPESVDDIAFWKLEPSSEGEKEGGENWIRFKDDKTSLEKLGLREAEEVGISFKDSNGKFPSPTVIRPIDDYEEEEEEVGIEE